MPDTLSQETETVPVGNCPTCGPVYGNDLNYNFPNPSTCSCGKEVSETVIADAETVHTKTK